MTDGFDDDLNRRLSSLESELHAARMPGAAAARQRAARRTRHQVTGGVLGGVAVIAIGVIGITQPTFTTAPAPAGTPTESTSPTALPPTPSDSPSNPQPSEPDGDDADDVDGTVPAEAFLTIADIDGEGTAWTDAPAEESWLPCVPDMPEHAEARSFESPSATSGTDVRLDQFIEETADGQAEARLDAVRRAVTDCAEGGADTSLIQVWAVDGLGDEAFLIAYSGPPSTTESDTYVTAGLVRTGNHVMSVFDGAPGMDYNGPAPEDRTVTATQRMCESIGGDCPGELDREQLYPEPIGDLDGWLRTDDVAEATGLDQFTEAGIVSDLVNDDGPGGWPYIGLPRDPVADGAESFEHRAYIDPFEPGATVDETIAHFGDESAARDHFDQLVAAANGFEQEGDVITPTGTVDGDGYAGASWRSENAEFGTVFVYGVVVRGASVAAVTSGMEEITGDQMTALLERAAQRFGD